MSPEQSIRSIGAYWGWLIESIVRDLALERVAARRRGGRQAGEWLNGKTLLGRYFLCHGY